MALIIEYLIENFYCQLESLETFRDLQLDNCF